MRAFVAVAGETVLVAALGFAMALLANAVSPRGLRLGRNYFPAVDHLAPGVNSGGVPAVAEDAVLRRLAQRNLRAATKSDAIGWFRDVQYAQGLIVFVDARDDAHYQAGHIPGAWQLNHYRAESFLPTVLPACLAALKVVVYCTGGQCEDSEFAAIMLRDAGVPAEYLFVYPGGTTEWRANGFPIETGPRAGGRLVPVKP